MLATAGVPAGPVLDLDQALNHPQTLALNLLKGVEYPQRAGTVPVADIPVSLSRTPGGIRHRPPQTSEHTDEILMALGFGEPDIRKLRADGVI